MRGWLAAAAGVCLATSVFSAPAEVQPAGAVCAIRPPGGNWNAAAQWIAGLNASAFSATLTPQQSEAWNDYSAGLAKDWGRFQRQYLNHIESWRAQNLRVAPGGLAFYPFGGPDAINLTAFYPDAHEYLMLGLEPVGCVPTSLAGYSPAYFAAMRRGLSDVIRMGFFVTANMNRDVTRTDLSGVLPLLLFLMARSGYTVDSVTLLGIGDDGVVMPAARMKTRETAGVEIQFSDARHGPRTLRYFAINLTDYKLRTKAGTAKFLNSLPSSVTLVKAASYLMHHPNFSMVRSLILAKSRVLLEDDSGVPYRMFAPGAWDIRLFGSYLGPSKTFREWQQPDLKAAYASSTGVQALDFAIGYRHKGDANLLLAVRKK